MRIPGLTKIWSFLRLKPAANQSAAVLRMDATPGQTCNFLEVNGVGGTGGNLFKVDNAGAVTSSGNYITSSSIFATSGLIQGSRGFFTALELAPIADTYSSSITFNSASGAYHSVNVTNTTPFTINSPSNPSTGRYMVIRISNAIGGGGSIGVITWNAIFKMDGSWANPADTKQKTIAFFYDGTNWTQIGSPSGDIS